MNKDIILKLINNGKSQRLIAKELETSQSNLRYWLNKYQIKTLLTGKSCLHKCNICGEEDSSKFYGHKKSLCSSCSNKQTLERQHKIRDYVIDKLGGECKSCGFKEFSCSLDAHHTNPSLKDPNFKTSRGWSLDRVDAEIANCILLCKNCHAATHAGHLQP